MTLSLPSWSYCGESRNFLEASFDDSCRYYPRVLYIDIDIHHGDGVEQAFYSSNRVFTVSIHKYFHPVFFPGTGKWSDDGASHGKHFCLNIPLSDGIDDDSYTNLFREVIDATITAFNPSAIVLQCGADSLGCDKLGAFNLSIAAHGDCVRFVKNFNLPLLVLGGGGYTIHNVSRCWTYETSVLVGTEISNDLPSGPFLSYFHPDYLLHPQIVQKVENENSPEVLRAMISGVKQKLRYLQGAPSVLMEEFPASLMDWLERDAHRTQEDEDVEGERDSNKDRDTRPVDRHFPTNEFFDGDHDNRGENVPMDEDEKDDRGGVGGGSSAATKRGGSRRGAGRKPRGRGGRVTFQTEEMDGEEDSASSMPPPPNRGVSARGKRGRGRGRGRGAAVVASSDPERPKRSESPTGSDRMSE